MTVSQVILSNSIALFSRLAEPSNFFTLLEASKPNAAAFWV